MSRMGDHACRMVFWWIDKGDGKCLVGTQYIGVGRHVVCGVAGVVWTFRRAR